MRLSKVSGELSESGWPAPATDCRMQVDTWQMPAGTQLVCDK